MTGRPAVADSRRRSAYDLAWPMVRAKLISDVSAVPAAFVKPRIASVAISRYLTLISTPPEKAESCILSRTRSTSLGRSNTSIPVT